MIDMPQDVPPAYEQVLKEKLTQCGLRNGGFIVRHEDQLQNVQIVIDEDAAASAAQFDCIRQAAGYQPVTFKNPSLQSAYQDRIVQTLQPRMVADAKSQLERFGILQGFPERSRYASDLLFARALEQKCGVKPGSFFVQRQGGLVGQPKPGGQSSKKEDGMACLMAAILYVSAKGESFAFSFTGNDASAR